MLGGHSLNAVALVLAIDRELDAEVPVGEVFTSPTVRQLAEYIERF
jgi:acyl carrier protein